MTGAGASGTLLKMTSRKPRRLGRPPASSSIETRQRIVAVAREAFAELGFGVTTNAFIATKAGITTGALYHYFDSKAHIYQAVYDEVQEHVYGRFEAAVAGAGSFIEKFEAVLEAAHALNREDPSLARFVGAARIDMARHDDLRESLRDPVRQGNTFLVRLVDAGVSVGEIRVEDRDMVLAFMRTTLVGLTDAVSNDPRHHRVAVDAIRAVMEGRLLAVSRSTEREPS